MCMSEGDSDSRVHEALGEVALVVRVSHTEFADFCEDYRAGKIGRDKSDRERLSQLVSAAVNRDVGRVRAYLGDPIDAKLRALLPGDESIEQLVALVGAAMSCSMANRYEQSGEVAAAAWTLARRLRNYGPRG